MRGNSNMLSDEYPPLTYADLAVMEEKAKKPNGWSAEYTRRPIAEIRRLRTILQASVPAAPAISPEERTARIKAARGALAHVPGSVDEFLRRKHEDIERENHRWDDG